MRLEFSWALASHIRASFLLLHSRALVMMRVSPMMQLLDQVIVILFPLIWMLVMPQSMTSVVGLS
jgi:hypothetical protein